jgi:hypothetical protein
MLETPEQKEIQKSPENTPDPKGQLADIVIKLIMGGGVGAGGLGAFWSLFKDSDIPKAITSAVIGLGISYGALLLKKVDEGNRRRLDQASGAIDQGIDEIVEKLKMRATGAKEAYLLCQALDCRDYKSEGMGSRDRIAIPMLQKVYVSLELDSSAVQAGLGRRLKKKPDDQQHIWDFLVMARNEPAYRKLAIVAWGGFGKTTLLKHLAYTFGTQQHQSFKAPPLVPILLPLRFYRKEINQPNPPSLPELIMQAHIKNLETLSPKVKQLSAKWFEEVLRKGDALVMLDGFDEVPEEERPAFERWINAQVRAFDQSIFLLTSRPTAYKENYNDSPFTKVWVNPLTPEQQEDFVRGWYLCQERLDRGGRMTPEVQSEADLGADNLLKQIFDHNRPELSDLSQNPLLLNLLARTHRSDPGVELPRQRAELYQDICTLQLRKRPDARGIQLPLSPGDRQGVLQEVALVMMQKKLKLIPEDKLLQLIKKILQHRQHNISAQTLMNQLIDVSELIVRQGLEGCEFSHLSFQEFLAATQVKQIGEEAMLYKYLKDANIPRQDRAWWRGTILLYASQSNPTKLIRESLRQNAPDLAYDCWQETRYGIDTRLTADLKALVSTLRSRRYTQLEDLLQAEKWELADKETYRLMITTVGKDVGQGFSHTDFANFPCDDLLMLDRLWVQASKGHFGFSIQKKIWQKCGSPMDYNNRYKDFMCQVGWLRNESAVNYQLLNFSLDKSPLGELPRWGNTPYIHMPSESSYQPRWGSVPRLVTKSIVGTDVSRWVLFERMETCQLTGTTMLR